MFDFVTRVKSLAIEYTQSDIQLSSGTELLDMWMKVAPGSEAKPRRLCVSPNPRVMMRRVLR
jgi:hypothetical protein